MFSPYLVRLRSWAELLHGWKSPRITGTGGWRESPISTPPDSTSRDHVGNDKMATQPHPASLPDVSINLQYCLSQILPCCLEASLLHIKIALSSPEIAHQHPAFSLLSGLQILSIPWGCRTQKWTDNSHWSLSRGKENYHLHGSHTISYQYNLWEADKGSQRYAHVWIPRTC